METIADSPLKIGRRKDFIPKVIAFVNIYLTPEKEAFNIQPYPGIENADKIMNEFPALDEMFMASVKQSEYV